MGKTHSLTGLTLWVAVAPALTDDPFHLLGGALLAGVLPYGADLDHPNSTASRKVFGRFHRKAGKPFAALMGGHRGGTHSLLAIVSVSLAFLGGATALAVYAAPWLDVRLVALAAALGWTGGILGDALTKQGVRFLWPLSQRYYGIPLFTTGKIGEVVFNLLQAGALGGALYLHGAS